MLSRKIIVHFLLFLQVLTVAQPGILFATAPVQDAEEICASALPLSKTFRDIQKQWVRLQTNAPGPKVQKFDLSTEALEKIAKKKGSKKHNAQLLSSILDLFIATSPKQGSALKFLKPRDWEDLQLFNTKNNLVSAISRTASKSGEVYLAGLITQRGPLSEVMERRDFIGALLERQDLLPKLQPLMQQFAKHELNLYSDTMQPENEVIKKSLESLAPGFLISLIPGASKNPGFLRFHALLTQKLSPWFYDPLTTQLTLGFALLSLMPNGIIQNIVKDFLGYTLKEMNERNTKLSDMGGVLSGQAASYIKDLKTNRTVTPQYVSQQLCPKGYRGKFFLSLLNDLFLWQTNELRVALHKNRNAGNVIDQPEYLVSGPHYSLWGNAQYRRNVTLDPLVRFLKDKYQAGYGKKHKNNPRITTPSHIITSMNKHSEAALSGESSEEKAKGILGAAADGVVFAAKHGTTVTEALKAKVDGIKLAEDASRKKRVLHGLLRLAAGTLHLGAQAAQNTHAFFTQPPTPGSTVPPAPAGQPGVPGAAAPAPTPHNQAFLDRLQRNIEYFEHIAKQPAPGIGAKIKYLDALVGVWRMKAEKRLFSTPQTKRSVSNVISYFENWKNGKKELKKVSLHLPVVKFILWIMVTYLFQLWRSNNGETQKNIKMLDTIMFETAKPGMLLLSAADSISALLHEHEQGLSIPSALKAKLKAFDELAKKQCKEVVSLAKNPTFQKSTGHRILDHTGIVRRGYQLIQQPQTRKLLVMAIHIMAEVDCYVGLSELVKEYAAGENQFCPVDFITSDTPFISAKNIWFPLLGKNAIGSDFLMGDKHSPNILLTGMNGGGKSISLKSSVFLITMAHAFGWVAAQQCSMTPFSELNLHLNSLDNAADGKSRWVAESDAIISMIHSVEAIHSPNYFIFICGDELGDGTAADASIKVMGTLLNAITKQKRALSFIASHLQKLTELEGNMPRIFNYRINPGRKLEPGVNQTNIAMAIFEKFSNTKRKEHGLASALANHTPSSDVQMIG